MTNLKELQRPMKNRWRVQSQFPKNAPTKCVMVAYVDARDVQDRLDDVVGSENWQSRFYESKGKQFCEISIKVGDQWICKSDCGTPTKTEAEKGEASDAFKRAAVQWGINRKAYMYGTVTLGCKEYNGKYYPIDEKGNWLKGEKLFDVCDKLAKVDEFEMAFDTLMEEEKNDNLQSAVLNGK